MYLCYVSIHVSPLYFLLLFVGFCWLLCLFACLCFACVVWAACIACVHDRSWKSPWEILWILGCIQSWSESTNPNDSVSMAISTALPAQMVQAKQHKALKSLVMANLLFPCVGHVGMQNAQVSEPWARIQKKQLSEAIWTTFWPTKNAMNEPGTGHFTCGESAF